jgi:hypothetical protein
MIARAMSHRTIPFLMTLVMIVIFACCSHSGALTQAELAKIDPRLRPALEGKPLEGDRCTTVTTRDGRQAYLVLIRGDAGQLREAGIHPGSVVGETVTAVLTADQIRAAARLSSVSSIRCGGTATPQ